MAIADAARAFLVKMNNSPTLKAINAAGDKVVAAIPGAKQVGEFLDSSSKKIVQAPLQAAYDSGQNLLDQEEIAKQQTGEGLNPVQKVLAYTIPGAAAVIGSRLESENAARMKGEELSGSDDVAARVKAAGKGIMVPLQVATPVAQAIMGGAGAASEQLTGTDYVQKAAELAKQGSEIAAGKIVDKIPGLSEQAKADLKEGIGAGINVGAQAILGKVASGTASKLAGYKGAPKLSPESVKAAETFGLSPKEVAANLPKPKMTTGQQLAGGAGSAAGQMAAQLGLASLTKDEDAKSAKMAAANVVPLLAAEALAFGKGGAVRNKDGSVQKGGVEYTENGAVPLKSVPFSPSRFRLEWARERQGDGYVSPTRDNPAYAAKWTSNDNKHSPVSKSEPANPKLVTEPNLTHGENVVKNKMDRAIDAEVERQVVPEGGDRDAKHNASVRAKADILRSAFKKSPRDVAEILMEKQGYSDVETAIQEYLDKPQEGSGIFSELVRIVNEEPIKTTLKGEPQSEGVLHQKGEPAKKYVRDVPLQVEEVGKGTSPVSKTEIAPGNPEEVKLPVDEESKARNDDKVFAAFNKAIDSAINKRRNSDERASNQSVRDTRNEVLAEAQKDYKNSKVAEERASNQTVRDTRKEVLSEIAKETPAHAKEEGSPIFGEEAKAPDVPSKRLMDKSNVLGPQEAKGAEAVKGVIKPFFTNVAHFFENVRLPIAGKLSSLHDYMQGVEAGKALDARKVARETGVLDAAKPAIEEVSAKPSQDSASALNEAYLALKRHGDERLYKDDKAYSPTAAQRATEIRNAGYENRDAYRQVYGERDAASAAKAAEVQNLHAALIAAGEEAAAAKLAAQFPKSVEAVAPDAEARLYGAGKLWLEQNGLRTRDSYVRATVNRSSYENYRDWLKEKKEGADAPDFEEAAAAKEDPFYDEFMKGSKGAQGDPSVMRSASPIQKVYLDVTGTHSRSPIERTADYARLISALKGNREMVDSIGNVATHGPQGVRSTLNGWRDALSSYFRLDRGTRGSAMEDLPSSPTALKALNGAVRAYNLLKFSTNAVLGTVRPILTDLPHLMKDAAFRGAASLMKGAPSEVLGQMGSYFRDVKSAMDNGSKLSQFLRRYGMTERVEFAPVGAKGGTSHNVAESVMLTTGTLPDVVTKRLIQAGALRDELGLDPSLGADALAIEAERKLNAMPSDKAKAVLGRVRARGSEIYNHDRSNTPVGNSVVTSNILRQPLFGAAMGWTRHYSGTALSAIPKIVDAVRSAVRSGGGEISKQRAERAARDVSTVLVNAAAPMAAAAGILTAWYAARKAATGQESPDQETINRMAVDLSGGSDLTKLGGWIKSLVGPVGYTAIPVGPAANVLRESANLRDAAAMVVDGMMSGHVDWPRVVVTAINTPGLRSANPSFGASKADSYAFEPGLSDYFLGTSQKQAASERVRDEAIAQKYPQTAAQKLAQDVVDSMFGSISSLVTQGKRLTNPTQNTETTEAGIASRPILRGVVDVVKEFASDPRNAGKTLPDLVDAVYGNLPVAVDKFSALGAMQNSGNDVARQNDAMARLVRDYGYRGDVPVITSGTDVSAFVNDAAKNHPAFLEAFLQALASPAANAGRAKEGAGDVAGKFGKMSSATVSDESARKFGTSRDFTDASNAVSAAMGRASQNAKLYANRPGFEKSVLPELLNAEKIVSVAHGSPELFDDVKESLGKSVADAVMASGGQSQLYKYVQDNLSKFPFLAEVLKERMKYAGKAPAVREALVRAGKAAAVTPESSKVTETPKAPQNAPSAKITPKSAITNTKAYPWIPSSSKKKSQAISVPSPKASKTPSRIQVSDDRLRKLAMERLLKAGYRTK